jgi:hypothetical protein
MNLFGPVVAAWSPATLVRSAVYPESLDDAISAASLSAARVSLLIGAGVAAGIYAALVYGLHSHMSKVFDVEIRKLAGGR